MEPMFFLLVVLGASFALGHFGSWRIVWLGYGGGIMRGICGFLAGYLTRPSFPGIGQISLAAISQVRPEDAKAFEPYLKETGLYLIGWTIGLAVVGGILGMIVGGLVKGKSGSPVRT